MKKLFIFIITIVGLFVLLPKSNIVAETIAPTSTLISTTLQTTEIPTTSTQTSNSIITFEDEEALRKYVEEKIAEALHESDLAQYLEEKFGISIIGFASVFSGFIVSFIIIWFAIKKYIRIIKELFKKASNTVEDISKTGNVTKEQMDNLIGNFKDSISIYNDAKDEYNKATKIMNGVKGELNDLRADISRLLEIEKIKIINNVDAVQDGVAKKIASVVNNEKSKE
jgi:hypothetical protein